jgi:hypothetical protein
VSKGLTHIKYNKYAPPPEEAAKMVCTVKAPYRALIEDVYLPSCYVISCDFLRMQTDEEFRASIYKRMKEAENERRKSGPVGGASSEDYLNSLSGGNE